MAADPDGGADAAAAEDASSDAAPAAMDATAPTADATVTGSTDASGEAGDDGSAGPTGPQYVQPDGALPVYTGAGNVFDLLCVQDPGVTFTALNTVKAPYADMAGCMAYARTGHAAAYACLCQNCFSLQQECDSLPGCQAIQKCGLDTGCTDPNSCYLIGGKCVTPINNYGTGSVSTALTQMLETCGMAATPTACPTQ